VVPCCQPWFALTLSPQTLSSLRFATKVNSAEIGVARKKMTIQ
jgi:hypothetical protein